MAARARTLVLALAVLVSSLSMGLIRGSSAGAETTIPARFPLAIPAGPATSVAAFGLAGDLALSPIGVSLTGIETYLGAHPKESRVLVATSISSAESLLSQLKVEVSYLAYDIERWDDTPVWEQEHPVEATQQMRAIADARGLGFIMIPSRYFNDLYGTQLAPYADLYIPQCMAYQATLTPAEFRTTVRALLTGLKAANPDIELAIHISPSPKGITWSAAQMLEATQGVADLIDRVSIWCTAGQTATVQEFALLLQASSSLEVTRALDWQGSTPQAESTLVCVTGPSFSSPSCRPASDGDVLVWSGISGGTYTITEPELGADWQPGVPVQVSVPPTAMARVTFTDTRLLPQVGHLSVTVTAAWGTAQPQAGTQFAVCLTGPSFADANCQAAAPGASLLWSNLVPGQYTVTERDLPANWVTDAPVTANVVAGQTASVQVNNTWQTDVAFGMRVYSTTAILPCSVSGDVRAVPFQNGRLTPLASKVLAAIPSACRAVETTTTSGLQKALTGLSLAYIEYGIGESGATAWELAHPVETAAQARQIADALGVRLILRPTAKVHASYGNQLAPYADVYVVDLSDLQSSKSIDQALASALTRLAAVTTAFPNLSVYAGIGATVSGVPQAAAQLADYVNGVKAVTDGVWVNVGSRDAALVSSLAQQVGREADGQAINAEAEEESVFVPLVTGS